jgi:signal transduction histidine kinase
MERRRGGRRYRPGIPAAEREKVFRRFYRRDASRGTEGAGLGLALVAAVASLHEADCTVPETSIGLSARITFPTFVAPAAATGGR